MGHSEDGEDGFRVHGGPMVVDKILREDAADYGASRSKVNPAVWKFGTFRTPLGQLGQAAIGNRQCQFGGLRVHS